jgi:hypothetical protein
MTMKPDWKDAPEWAKFLAQDCDGRWHWFEAKPEWDDGPGEWVYADDTPDTSRFQQAAAEVSHEYTLEPRP